MKRNPTLTLALVLVFGLAALGSAVATADEAKKQETKAASETATAEPAPIAGMMVGIDPVTGALRAPTAGEAAELSAAIQRMFAGDRLAAPQPVHHRNGSVILELGLSQLDFSVATVGADGEVTHKCLDEAHAARAHVHGQTAQPEEK